MRTKSNKEFLFCGTSYSVRKDETTLLSNNIRCNKYSIWKIDNTNRIFDTYIYETTFSKAIDAFKQLDNFIDKLKVAYEMFNR